MVSGLEITSRRKRFLFSAACLFLWILPALALADRVLPSSKIEARDRRPRSQQAGVPVIAYAVHNHGNMQLVVTNTGTFGSQGQDIVDPLTGQVVPSCIYPKNSDLVFLWCGALWVGAIVGRDTLVSVGAEDLYSTQEFWPEVQPFGDFKTYSIDVNSSKYDADARSEQDLVCEYTDTVTLLGLTGQDDKDVRPHRPLGIKVTQRSMAWSYSYADDWILFDLGVENIGTKRLKNVYMGIWVDGDAFHKSRLGPEGYNDDIVGFYRTHPAPEGCGFVDTVNIAWHADNDGDPISGAWDYRSIPHSVGARIVRTPSDSLAYSYNWWITNYGDPSKDFGPRMIGTETDPFRDFGGVLGTPEGDRNKYYVLSHREFDYDLLYTAQNHTFDGFLPPPDYATEITDGFDSRYLLSFGPFILDPGQTMPISFAWVGGMNFHVNPNDFKDLFNAGDPSRYYRALNFDNLATNSRWATWVYDNPGVDTDRDGYAGKFRVCVRDSVLSRIDTTVAGTDTVFDSVFVASLADTTYYEGDGVPDFRGASPPPAPYLKVIPEVGKLTVRWNGYRSETTPDVFLGRIDFEGYRVYKAFDNRPGSFSLVQSFDREDFNKYIWVTSAAYIGWKLLESPFTLDSLRQLYGSGFNPLQYTRQSPMIYRDSFFYFEPQDYNMSSLASPRGIHKVYPDAPLPPHDSSLWTYEDVTEEHGFRLPRYYEYEYIMDGLEATVPLYVAVTAFDYGSPEVGIQALETNPTNNFIYEYPLTPSDSVTQQHLDAYVYPNPYRFDAGYVGDGYEKPSQSISSDRARRIHFANLPNVCKISIYTLDGDLVRTIDHNYPSGGPGSMHESWDLVTRNAQAVASGLYYWIIESAGRTQIGKLAIIE